MAELDKNPGLLTPRPEPYTLGMGKVASEGHPREEQGTQAKVRDPAGRTLVKTPGRQMAPHFLTSGPSCRVPIHVPAPTLPGISPPSPRQNMPVHQSLLQPSFFFILGPSLLNAS